MNEQVLNLLLMIVGFGAAVLYRNHLIRKARKEYEKEFRPSVWMSRNDSEDCAEGISTENSEIGNVISLRKTSHGDWI